MNLDEAKQIIDNYLCAVCWRHLTLPHGAEQPVCSEYPEHEGYVTKYFVEKQKEADRQNYQEAKGILQQSGVIENPHKGKTSEQLLSELGF